MSAKLPAIYMWDRGGLNIAIPKQKGEGYLRAPYGHHFIQALSDIELAERVDMDGLDGYLNLDYRHKSDAERGMIVARVMPKLADYFKFSEWREDTKEFWRIVEAKP